MSDPKRFLTWTCPRRATPSRELKNIPTDVFDEIFSWLRPTHDPDMTLDLHHRTMALIARVCRYFAYYSIREISYNLDFNGKRPSKAPTGTWCTGIIKRHEPMETLRKGVKTCAISNWIVPAGGPQATAAAFDAFLKLFPRVIPKLENLHSINFCEIPISKALFDSISKLRHLEDLCIRRCYLQKSLSADASSRAKPKTPFPALRQLTIAESEARYAEANTAFCLLASAPALKVLTLADSCWFPIMRSHLSSDLLALNVHLSCKYPVSDFVAYLKTCTVLRDLAVFLLGHDKHVTEWGNHGYLLHNRQITYEDREHFRLAPEDLRSLRSFIGPLWLATIFVDTRPVSHVAVHLKQGYVSSLPPSEHEFGGLNSWYKPVAISSSDYPIDFEEHLDELVETGRDVIQVLSLPIDRDMEMGAVPMPHLPNLLRLQVYFPMDTQISIRFLKKGLEGYQRLELLHIYTNAHLGKLPYELSPGDQHFFVEEWGASCTTLSKIIFGSYMVWHRRRSATSSEVALSSSNVQEGGDAPTTLSSLGSSPHVIHHLWDLEILSPRGVRRGLEERASSVNPGRVRDWGGKLDGLLGPGSPLKNKVLSPQAGPLPRKHYYKSFGLQ